MDALFELFAPFVGHWRVAVATLSALLIAAMLAYLVVSFTAGYGIGLVLLGLGAGMLWEANAVRGKDTAGIRNDA
jgi:hypothetical protein